MPWVIGKSKVPVCLRNVNMSLLPVTYRNNKKAWMVSGIFHEWLLRINEEFKLQCRKVLLLVDNAPSHLVPACEESISDSETDDGDGQHTTASRKQSHHCRRPRKKVRHTSTSEFSNVEICFLPPNTTAHLQPMDAGIIKSFKAQYKKLYVRYLLQQYNENENRV